MASPLTEEQRQSFDEAFDSVAEQLSDVFVQNIIFQNRGQVVADVDVLLKLERDKFTALQTLFTTMRDASKDAAVRDRLSFEIDKIPAILNAINSIIADKKIEAKLFAEEPPTEWKNLHAAVDAFDNSTLKGFVDNAPTAINAVLTLFPGIGRTLGLAIKTAGNLIRPIAYSFFFESFTRDQFQTVSGIEILNNTGGFVIDKIGSTLLAGASDDAGHSNFNLDDLTRWNGVTNLSIVGNSSDSNIRVNARSLENVEIITQGGNDVISIKGGIGEVAQKVYIDAGNGHNTIEIEGIDVTVKGGSGIDEVTILQSENLTLDLGDGNDYITLKEFETGGSIDGGSGSDTVDYSVPTIVGYDGLTVVMNAGGITTVTSGELTQTVKNIENFVLSPNDDIVTGNNESNTIQGLGGNDTFIGKGGSDTLHGGRIHQSAAQALADGHDTADYSSDPAGISITIGNLYGTAGDLNSYIKVKDGYGGNDSLYSIEKIIGTSGDDILAISSLKQANVLDPLVINIDGNSPGSGSDTIDFSGLKEGIDASLVLNRFIGRATDLRANYEGFENVTGSSKDDLIFGNDGINKLDGNSGDDKLVGGDGADKIYGGSGDDKIWNGYATLSSDDGSSDTLEGGAGYDTYYVGKSDVVLDSNGKGKVVYNGSALHGGRLTGSDGSASCGSPGHDDNSAAVYIDEAGNKYHSQGSNLIVDLAGGGSITIKDWSQDQLEIRLGEQDLTSGGAGPCDPPQEKASPLILDLDGDGIETTQLRDNSVFFDVDKDGLKERTAWVSSDDGLLALDRNHNGIIDDASELFGYGKAISVTGTSLSPENPTAGIDESWLSGFRALAAVQTVFDGVLDARDAVFSELRVWRDFNQDGKTDTGELFSLTDLGITSINLNATHNVIALGDNLLTDQSTYTLANGTVRGVGDVWFAFDQQTTEYDSPAISAAIAALPNIMGVGAVKDLHSAAAEDPVLAAMLQQFAAINTTNFTTMMDQSEHILKRWFGIEKDFAGDRGPFSDASHIAVYEGAFDTPFQQWSGPNPRPVAAAQIEEDYQLYLRNTATRMFLQTSLGQQMFPELSFKQGAFVFLAPNTLSTTVLDRLFTGAPTETFKAIDYWHNALFVLDGIYGSFSDVKASATGLVDFRNAVTAHLEQTGIHLTYEQFIEGKFGGAGDDLLVTRPQAYGFFYSTSGGFFDSAQTVVGGSGNDEILSGSQKQIVYWGAGQGNDTLSTGAFSYFGFEIKPHVELRLVGLSASDITVSRNPEQYSNDVIITINATGETFTLNGGITQSTLQSLIVFGDGTSAHVFSPVLGTANLALESTSGDDYLNDITGANLLDGGAGNDTLIGRDGDDTYVFGRGYGSDAVVETSTSEGSDTILLKAGIEQGDIELIREDELLIIKIIGTSDSISVQGQFQEPDKGMVNVIQFADGTTLNYQDIFNAVSGTVSPRGYVYGWDWQSDYFNVGSDGGQTYLGFDRADNYTVNFELGSFTIEDYGTDFGKDIVEFDKDLGDITITRTSPDVFVFSLDAGHQVIVDTSKGLIEEYHFRNIILDSAEMAAEILNREQAAGFTRVVGTSLSEHFIGTEGFDDIYGAGGSDIIEGRGGDDRLKGYGSNDIILGGDGNDTIEGSYGDDDLTGGAGNDIISDIGDDTTVHFDVGDGSDVLLVTEGNHDSTNIVFGAGITSTDLRFSFEAVNGSQYSSYYGFASENYGVKINIGTGSDSILLIAYKLPADFTGSSQFTFFDGSHLLLSDVLAGLRTPNALDQLIVGSSITETISGGAGNDILVGSDGYGSKDNFAYSLGDGNDIIIGNETTGSEIHLGPGITMSDIHVTGSGDHDKDIILTFGPNSETLTIKNQFTDRAKYIGEDPDGNHIFEFSSRGYVNKITFTDGSVWTSAELLAMIRVATAGDDIIVGSAAPETFDGGAGNDILVGGITNDIYLFGRGSGSDVIIEKALATRNAGDDFASFDNLSRVSDELHFGISITAADLEITIQGQNQTDMLIHIKGTTDTVLLRDQLLGDGNWGLSSDSFFGNNLLGSPLFESGIEKFVFADGTEFNRAQFLELGVTRNNAGANTIATGDAGGILDGGAGADLLNGGIGNDTYILGLGYGEDIAADRGGSDVLKVKGAIDPSVITFTRAGMDGNDLLIEVDGTDRLAITIKGQFADSDTRIEAIKFDDGTTWKWDEIQNYLLSTSISSGNDHVNGFHTADIIRTRGGDDVIRTGGGSDFIDGGAGWDVVELEGRQDRYLVESTSNGFVVTDIGLSGDRVTLVNVESIKFLGASGTGAGSGTITPNGNLAPTSHALNFAQNEDTSLRLAAADVLAGASDPEGGSLTLVSVSNGMGGTVTYDPVHGVVFTPTLNFSGQATFTYIARDSGGLTVQGTASVTINPVNDSPIVAHAIVDQASLEDALFTYTIPAGTFTDIETASLSLTASLTGGEPLPTWLSFNAVSGVFSGTPPLNQNGTIAITVTASDGIASATSDFSIDITPVNDAPILATPLADQSFIQGQAIDYAIPSNTFSDIDGDQLFLVATLGDGSDLPSWLSFNGDTGAFSGTPPANFGGSFDIKVTASDGSLTATDIFSLTIAASNAAPIVALPLVDIVVAEDAAINFTLPAGSFMDANGDALSYVATLGNGSALPSWLAFNAATQTFTGNPPTNFNGLLDVKVTASDSALSVADTFTLAITPVNDAPVVAISLVDQSSLEDTTWSFIVPAGTFSDIDGDALTYVATLGNGATLPTWLSFNAATQTFSGTPPTNFNGSLDVKVIASDGLLSASGVFTLNITPVNDAPIVANLLIDRSSPEDTGVSFSLPANAFSDVDGDSLSYAATLSTGAALPSWLAFSATTRTFSGTPPANFNGSFDVKVTASDGSLSASDVFTLSITPVNDAPVTSVLLADRSSPEDSSLSFTLPPNSFTDVDGDALSYVATLSNGFTLPVWLSFNGTTQAFTGTPPANFNGTIDVKVTTSDGSLSASDVFTLTITPVNDAPVVAVLLADRSSAEDTSVSFTLPTNAFTDVDGDTLGYVATLSNGNALPTWLSFNAASQTFSGTPPANFNGSFDVKVTATDGSLTASDVFTLTITPVNDAPAVASLLADQSVAEDTNISFTLPANAFSDVDSDALAYSAMLSSGAALPTWLTFNTTTRNFTGTPPANLNGSFDVKVMASDGSLSASDVFSLAITPVNDAPILVALLPDKLSAEDTAFSFTIPTGSFTDVDNASLGYSATLGNGAVLPAWLTFSTTTGTFSGTPPANFNGSIDVKVVASDGSLSASDLFTLTITPLNDAPIVANLLPDQSSAEDTALSFVLPANAFSDVDGNTLSYAATLSTGSALPLWLSFNATSRTFSGTPPANFNGSLDVKVMASDGSLNASDIFTLTITPVNDGPVAGADGVLPVVFNTALVITAASLLANDTDVDGDKLTIQAVSAPTNGSVSLNAAGSVVFTPTAGFAGAASFTYTISDGHGGTANGLVSLNVVANTGLNVINGTAGADIIFGTVAGDLINAGNGDDIVYGDNGNDMINGGAGNDIMYGGAGTDTLIGGLGNDTYVVDNATDITTENVNEGTDLVLSSINWTLAANIENLTLVNTTAINGTGNSLDNIVIGGTGANILNGGAGNDTLDGFTGADTLIGGLGNDTYFVDNLGDITTEAMGEGNDLVQSSINWILATNVENLTLTGSSALNGMGNTLINVVTGNAGNNILDGGAGADNLIGGLGNDTYIVDNVGDVTTEATGEGVDLVQSSVNWTLAANVENLTLTGTSTINGTGNTLANVITGNSANNILDGGTGADTMNGGIGNDTYIVDNASDVTIEAASSGTDLVLSSMTWTLATNLENLTLTGATAINGTGNILNNILTGNSAINILSGGAGADRLIGGAGNDTLTGGLGNDSFNFANGFGKDIVTDFTAGAGIADVINLSIGTTFDTYAEVMAVATQVGANTVFTFTAADTITLTGVLKTALVADDFLFV